MTVPVEEPRTLQRYTGTGIYEFAFRTYQPSHIVVYYRDAEGIAILLEQNTDYTVALDGAPDHFGRITVLVDQSAPYGAIEIRRVLPLSQMTSWVNNDPLPMPLIELSYDQQVMMLQQINEIVIAGVQWANFRGDWVTDRGYEPGNMVRVETKGWNVYGCLQDHLSGVFEDDLLNGYWTLVFDMEAVNDALDACLVAQAAAELAQSLAEEAQQAAEQAEAGSEAARDLAIAAQVAAEVAQVAAEVAQGLAEAAQAGAEAAEIEAGGWATKSEEWATNPYGAPVEVGLFSSFHWSTQSNYWSDFYTDLEAILDPVNWVPNNPGDFSARIWSRQAQSYAEGLDIPPAADGDLGDILVVVEKEPGDPGFPGFKYDHIGIDISVVGNLKSDGSVQMDALYEPTEPLDIATKVFVETSTVQSVTAGEGIAVGGTPTAPTVSVQREAQHPFSEVQSAAGAVSMNIVNEPVQHLTMTAACVISITGPTENRAFTTTIRIINPTGFDLTLPAGISWPADMDVPAVGDWAGTWEFNMYTVDAGVNWIGSNRVEY